MHNAILWNHLKNNRGSERGRELTFWASAKTFCALWTVRCPIMESSEICMIPPKRDQSGLRSRLIRIEPSPPPLQHNNNNNNNNNNSNLKRMWKHSLYRFFQTKSYLGASITSMSATFPGSRDPWVCDRPKDAAALIVAATRDSSIVMCRLTQARCIVKGWSNKIR